MLRLRKIAFLAGIKRISPAGVEELLLFESSPTPSETELLYSLCPNEEEVIVVYLGVVTHSNIGQILIHIEEG